MNTSQIINLVKINGGISLDTQFNIAKINKGYMVSVEKYEYIVDIHESDRIDSRLSYMKNILKDSEYIGLWYDDNKLYIDLSKNIKNIGNAKSFAIKNNQKAIYDISKNNVIYM